MRPFRNLYKGSREGLWTNLNLEITDEDIRGAQKDLKSYVDVTDEDLRLITVSRSNEPARDCAVDHLPGRAGMMLPPGKASQGSPWCRNNEILWSSLGALRNRPLRCSRFFEPRDLTLIIGSFGASAVLICRAVKAFAQPETCWAAMSYPPSWCNRLGVLGGTVWLAAAIAVSLAIAAMLATNTVHPPGGATALIAVIGGQQIHDLGFLYPVLPVGAGAVVLLLVALLVNNIPRGRRYPLYWF